MQFRHYKLYDWQQQLWKLESFRKREQLILAQNCEILAYKHQLLSLGCEIEAIGGMISGRASNLQKNVDGSFVVRSTSQDNNISFMIVIKEESIGKELVAEASSLICIWIKVDDSLKNEENSFPTVQSLLMTIVAESMLLILCMKCLSMGMGYMIIHPWMRMKHNQFVVGLLHPTILIPHSSMDNRATHSHYNAIHWQN